LQSPKHWRRGHLPGVAPRRGPKHPASDRGERVRQAPRRRRRTTLEKELAARLFYLLVHLEKADTLLLQQATYYQEATIIVAGKPTTVTTGKLTLYQTLISETIG
jgi:hypothetical protein